MAAISQGNSDEVELALLSVEHVGRPVAGEVLSKSLGTGATAPLSFHTLDALAEAVCFHVVDPEEFARHCFLGGDRGLSVAIWLRAGVGDKSEKLLRSLGETDDELSRASAHIVLLPKYGVSKSIVFVRRALRETYTEWLIDAMAAGLSRAHSVDVDSAGWAEVLGLLEWRDCALDNAVGRLAGKRGDAPKIVSEPVRTLISEIVTAEEGPWRAVLAGLIESGAEGRKLVLELVERRVLAFQRLLDVMQTKARLEDARALAGGFAQVLGRRGQRLEALWVLRVFGVEGPIAHAILSEATNSKDGEVRRRGLETAIDLMDGGVVVERKGLASAETLASAGLTDESILVARVLATEPSSRDAVRAWVRRHWSTAPGAPIEDLVEIAQAGGAFASGEEFAALLTHPSEPVRAVAVRGLASVDGCRFVEWIRAQDGSGARPWAVDGAIQEVQGCRAEYLKYLVRRARSSVQIYEILVCASLAAGIGADRETIVELLFRASVGVEREEESWRWSAWGRCLGLVHELGIYDPRVMEVLHSYIAGRELDVNRESQAELTKAWRALHAEARR